jgi:3-hydroxyacyl-CoA dehydrogenase
VLNFEFHTKMNSIGGEVIAGFRKSIEMAEKDFAGLVISNSSAVFSAGANLGMVFMLAAEQEYEELDMAIRAFQSFTMLARLSKIPVVVAPKGLTLGGSCELSMHADGVQAAAETYVGLVEVGVGVIPGGGGTKEFALRLSDRYRQGDVEYNTLSQIYMNMATAKVATSAMEAKAMGIFRESDRISLFEDHRIAQARDWVLEMAAAGYNPPSKRQDIRVPGKAGMALLLAGVNGMHMGRYISDHDRLIAQKLAYVLCGGDLSYPQLVSEQYLLDLEREAFLSLCGERKTLERIQHMLKTGKALRN